MASDKFIVDTHAIIWFLEGNPKLGPKAKIVLDDSESHLVLPIIALAEAVDIVEKGRTRIPSIETLLTDIFDDSRIEIFPFRLEVLSESRSATSVPEMHDRLIVATGLLLKSMGDNISILTKDASIVASGLLPIVW
jgi:PIN domain nuclease of toxin-antitoxin system